MDEADLLQRFPNLRVIEKPPALGAVLGCGTGLFGALAYDEETNTCVKVHTICILGIPVLALGAYRVVDRPGRYLFLGREPLSGSAKAANWAMLAAMLALCVVGGWTAYTSSPDYIARRDLAEANRLAEAGEVGKAADLYHSVAGSGTVHAQGAQQRLLEIANGQLERYSAANVAGVLRNVVAPGHGVVDAALVDRALALAASRTADDPRGALSILDAVAPAAKDPARLAARRGEVLEKIVARDPGDVDALSDLAVVYEGQGNIDKCAPLLKPQSARLGDREGARILGHILAVEGKLDEALALLQPYTDSRLGRLQAAEKALEKAIDSARDRLVEEVKGHRARGFNYERFRTASDREREEMFYAWANPQLEADPAIKAASAALNEQSPVVGVALDLGAVHLQRAQEQAEPAARRKELEAAEKVFLAVRGAAAETDEYRLNLAQVYYWLGKHAEGRKLFDETLAAHPGQTELALRVAQRLRQVGDHSGARELMGKAYQEATDPRWKYQAAHSRALESLDLDDEIEWLGRADPADPAIKALLSSSRGRRAARAGREEEAITCFRQAVTAYDGMPVNEASLNNSAGTFSLLYQLTGDRKDLEQSKARYDKAAALAPSNALVLGNAAQAQLEIALWDAVAGELDLAALREAGSVHLLYYLCADETGRRRLGERLRNHAGVAAARARLERLLVLAPRSEHAYGLLASLANFCGDQVALQRLLTNLSAVELDLADTKRQTLDFYRGAKDEEWRDNAATAIKREEQIVLAAKSRGGATFAVAACRLALAKMSGEALGLPCDADAVVRLCEEAHAAAPSHGTYAALDGALSFRINRTLVDGDPDFARLRTRCQRSTRESALLTAYLSGHPDRAAALQTDADFRRLIDSVRSYDAKFPNSPSAMDAVLLKAAGRPEAADLARRVLADVDEKLMRQVTLVLSPLDVSNALECYWCGQLAGAEADALPVVKRLADQGVPLPVEAK
jgi:tetratricopeptide (TPR) repeat protein